jgi:hypothetical protein
MQQQSRESMTEIEMLDALEDGIAALHTERAKLAAALDLAQQQLVKAGRKRSKTRRKPPKKARISAKKPAPAPNEAPAPVAAQAEAAPVRRKRQALGRTLAQLRSSSRREVVDVATGVGES